MDYNRAEKHKLDAEKIKKSTTRHLSTLQKILAFIGTCLGLITASITIYTFTHPSTKAQPAPKVVKEKVIERSTPVTNQSGSSHVKTNDSELDTKISSSTTVDNGAKTSTVDKGATTSTNDNTTASTVHSSTPSSNTVSSSSSTETVPSSEVTTNTESNNISSNATTNTVLSGNNVE